MKQFVNFFLIAIFPVLLFTSCSPDNEKAPDVSGIQIEFTSHNINEQFFTLPGNTSLTDMEQLFLKYPMFTKYYLGIEDKLDSNLYAEFVQFRKDSKVNELYSEQKKVFLDFGTYTGELKKAFTYYRYYFQGKFIPEVDYFFTSYIYEILAVDSLIVISPEFFFRSDYKYLGQFYEYQRRRFRPEYMVPKAIYEFGLVLEKEFTSKTLAASMIYFGRAYYFAGKLLPGYADSLVIGYKQKQLDWCRKNETQIWGFFNERNLLFDETQFRTRMFVTDGPHTNEMSKESPGRIGHWVGLQLVNNYMKNNKEVTLEQLMEEKDFMKIFNGARYKPK